MVSRKKIIRAKKKKKQKNIKWKERRKEKKIHFPLPSLIQLKIENGTQKELVRKKILNESESTLFPLLLQKKKKLTKKENHHYHHHYQIPTCIFHVRGLCVCRWPFAAVIPAFACFVCCIIWLMRSSCCRVSPSFPAPAGEDGDDGSPPLNWMQVAPCGELASPMI